MKNLPKFCLSRNGAYANFTVLVHFWLRQIYPLKAQNIAKKLKFFKKLHPQEYQLKPTQSQAQEFSANYVPLFNIIKTHS